jgi:Asp-tRNA(Asn)/Glu-tRNA(Gln) amidotransferase A subunit family amidase
VLGPVRFDWRKSRDNLARKSSMSTDLAQLPLHALAAKLKSRSISPVDIVASCLDRIAKLDPKLHAFVEVYETEAHLAAEAAEKAIRSGHGVGPLHGIPIALKDLIELEGRVTTGGTAVWRDRRAARTATLAQKLIGAGMIVIGKTHTVEFAFGGWGTNQHLGTPWNPWDAKTHRTPGGSSSGSGVAVAARMVPCALGDADPMSTLRRGVKGLRLGCMAAAERDGVAADVLAAYDRSVEQLAAMGADIVDLALPRSFRDYGSTSGRIMAAEAYALLSHIVDNNEQPVDEAVRPRIRGGAAISAREYLEVLAERERLKLEFAGATTHVDALLTPVTMTPPIPIATVDQSTTPAFFTRWVNFLDLCGLAVPNGMTTSGLPLSLQIVCPGGDEAMALRIGWAWQNATDWHERVPPLAQ